MTTSRDRIFWTAAVLLAVGTVFRLIGQLNSGLWYDEIWTLLDFGRLPLVDLVSSYGSDNNHPLYSLSAWFSLNLLGESAWALRLPAVVFGVASLWVSYRFASYLADREEALWTLALLTFSYHHVWFSQNARGYTALLFFSVLGVWHFLRALDHGRRKDVIIAALAFGLGSYVHLTGVFVAVAAFAAGLAASKKPNAHVKAALLSVVAGGVLSLLLHAMILGEMLEFFTRPSDKPATAVDSEWKSPWWTVKAAAESLGLGLMMGLGALAAAAAVMAAGLWAWSKKNPIALIALVLPSVIGAAVMLGLGRNLWPRFFFFAATFFIVIAVRGGRLLVSKLLPVAYRRRAEYAGLGLALAAFLVILPRAWTAPKQDFEGALAWLQSHKTNAVPVYTAGLTDKPLNRYHGAGLPHLEGLADLQQALQQAPHAKVWVVHTLPAFVRSETPALAERIEGGKLQAEFHGTVGGGLIRVLEISTPP